MSGVLVTGAGGFLGRAIVPVLAARRPVRAVTSQPDSAPRIGHVEWVVGPRLGTDADWSPLLRDIQVVVHLAAIAHTSAGDPAAHAARVREVNAAGTLRLARQAVERGASRFVFMSSVKALAERSGARPLRPDDRPAPEDAYGEAKLEAERGLAALAADGGLDCVVLRPPLVYGPQAKGNFARLGSAVRRGLPLPFASVQNRRSLISVWNLADAVEACIDQAAPCGGTYHVADERSVSTGELVELIARGLGVRARLLPIPPAALRWGLVIAGQRDLAGRLLDSLELDTSFTRARLGWVPRLGIEAGIVRAMQEPSC